MSDSIWPKVHEGDKRDILVRQIDALQEMSKKGRDDILGTSWEQEVSDFYNLTLGGSANESPSFRPKIQIPELQMLFLSEASDLAENSPRIYISTDSGRDKEREKALQAKWTEGQFNLQILYAELWALFCNVGFIQVGWDKDARKGRGDLWIKARQPKTVFVDPNGSGDDDLAWVIFHDLMYIDTVRKQWPERGYEIKVPSGSGGNDRASQTLLNVPPGPLRSVAGLPFGSTADGSGRVLVRTCFVRDYSIQEVVGEQNPDKPDIIAEPKFVPVYPNGRLIIECEGTILHDGANPVPQGHFPLIGFPALPALTGFYCPPPSRYSRGAQDLAEKMMSNIYENGVRLNNGITYSEANNGIDPESWGNVPAEFHQIVPGTKPPVTEYPNPMPDSFLQMPLNLLKLQREVQGFSDARKGPPPSGNVSAPLFDAAVSQSQPITRMRSRLFAAAIERLAKLVFVMMAEFFKREVSFMVPGGDDGIERVTWKPILEDYSDYSVMLDPGSVKAISGSALRNLVPVLLQLHVIDPQTAGEWLEIPNYGEIAKRMQEQLKLQAAAGIKQKGKK